MYFNLFQDRQVLWLTFLINLKQIKNYLNEFKFDKHSFTAGASAAPKCIQVLRFLHQTTIFYFHFTIIAWKKTW